MKLYFAYQWACRTRFVCALYFKVCKLKLKFEIRATADGRIIGRPNHIQLQSDPLISIFASLVDFTHSPRSSDLSSRGLGTVTSYKLYKL